MTESAQPILREIPLAMLTPSPTNPRKRFDERELGDLAASIREKGVIEPIVVRRSDDALDFGTHEIVVGERRWRASKLAGCETIPCLVRDLSPVEAFEIQIAENNQRADVTPLEEADAIRIGVEQLGRSVEELAGRLGRSDGYVAARLVIGRAPESVRGLLDEGLVTVGAATILARAPESVIGSVSERARKQAVAKGEPLSRRDVSLIVDRFARALADAPFDLGDAKLTRLNARPCTTCTDRTSSQGALFADAAGDDRCLDAECWEAKVAGLWERAQKDAKKRKLPILEEPWDGSHTGYFETRSPAYAADTNDTWSTIIDPSDVVIGRTEYGRVVELVAPATIERFRGARASDRGESIPQGSTETDEEREERLANQAEQRDRAELGRWWPIDHERTFARIEEDGATDEDLVRILAATVRVPRVHALRLGLVEPGAPDYADALDRWRSTASLRDLAKLLVADAMMDRLFDDTETLDGLLRELAEGQAVE